jgi:hypothetical protein
MVMIMDIQVFFLKSFFSSFSFIPYLLPSARGAVEGAYAPYKGFLIRPH